MEIVLAIVVASAVIFFGALISMGNERQRRAIDGLREQVVLWAVQDLRLKREHIAHNINITNPVDWLTKVASKACGYDLNLQVREIVEDPQILFCTSGDGGEKIFFSLLSPVHLTKITKGKQNRLSQLTPLNQLLFLHKKTETYELSTLNAGLLFDLELSFVWKKLLNHATNSPERLWMYIIK